MQSIKWKQHWMLVFVPIAMWLGHSSVGDPLKFLVAALAIVPIARLIGHSTEHLSHYTGDSIGGLLNATFGNLPELIICVVALKAGLYSMVTASLIGAILFNLLLVLGLSFLLGGFRHHTLQFNTQATRVYSTMMFIAVISMALPSIYENAFAPGEATLEQDKINIGLAIVLFVLYVLYLVYMIRTHPEEFASVAKKEDSEHGQHWSLALCIGVLVASSVLAAVLSEVLVGAVEGTGEALGLSTAFLGIVLLASVGGVAEGMSAVTMAMQGPLRPVARHQPRQLHPHRVVCLAGIGVRELLRGTASLSPVLQHRRGRPAVPFGPDRSHRRDWRKRQLVQGRAAARRVPDDRAAALFRAALRNG